MDDLWPRFHMNDSGTLKALMISHSADCEANQTVTLVKFSRQLATGSVIF